MAGTTKRVTKRGTKKSKTSRKAKTGITVWTADKPYMGNHVNWGFTSTMANHLKKMQTYPVVQTGVFKYDLYTNPGPGIVGGGINNNGAGDLWFTFFQNGIQVFMDRTLIQTIGFPNATSLGNMFEYFRIDKVEIQRIYGNTNSNAFSPPAIGDNAQSTNTGQLPIVYSCYDYNTNYAGSTSPDITFVYVQNLEDVQITQFGQAEENKKIQVFQPQAPGNTSQLATSRPWIDCVQGPSTPHLGIVEYVDNFSANNAPLGQGPALQGTFTYIFKVYITYRGMHE